MSSLSALSVLISSGVASIEATYATNGEKPPILEDPFRGPGPLDVEVMQSAAVVIAAAGQLIAALRLPPQSILDASAGMYCSSALAVIGEFNIVEILRESGPQGLHVKDIGARAKTDSDKLGRILRFLASRHIFREISPDVFTNNRISSVMDTGKSVEEILAHPLEKHDNTSGLPALVAYVGNEGLKSNAFMVENLVDEKTASSQEANDAPFNRAYDTRLGVWEWFELPENALSHRRFGKAMYGITNFFPAELAVGAYDWKSLSKGDLVVDVGGGIGSATLHVAKAFPDLRFIVQGREGTVAAGTRFFQSEYPEALSSGQVKFQVHGFFTPQPIKDAAIFMLRFISHGFPTEIMKKVLTRLRASAQSTTKLLLLDLIIPYAAPSSNEFPDIPGSGSPPVPEPLLPNLGIANSVAYWLDMQMMNFLNSQDRTVGQFIALVDGTGWKLSLIRPAPLGHISTLVFVPI